MLRNLVYGFLYITIHFMIRIGWWRWRVEGLENLPPRDAGGMILVMNHIHWIDIPVVGALLPFRYRLSWLAKSELFEHPISNWFFKTMDVIPIRRGKGDLMALGVASDALRKGAVLLIFPEGHRSRTGVLQRGRGGAARLALNSGAPLVPLAINGTQGGVRGTLARKAVVLHIGKPCYATPMSGGKLSPDTVMQLTREMMQQIAGMLPEAYRGPYLHQSHEVDATLPVSGQE